MVGYRSAEEPVSAPSTAEKKSKKRIIIVAASVAVLLAVILGILLSLFGGDKFNYLKSDLTDYISFSSDSYKNYTLEIDFDEVTDADVDRKIMKLLYQKLFIIVNYLESLASRAASSS